MHNKEKLGYRRSNNHNKRQSLIQHYSSPNKLPLRLYPTNRCNLRCTTPLGTQFCDHSYEEIDADLDSLILISKLFVKSGLTEILKISGREPTLYNELPILIERLAPYFRKIMLSSNGTAPLELYDNLIEKGVNIFAISYHTNDENKFIKMSGISPKIARKYFHNLNSLIKHLSEKDCELQLIRVVIKGFNDLKQDLEDFINLCGKYNAMGKIFELNFHPDINRIIPYNSPIKMERERISDPAQIFYRLRVNLSDFHDKIKQLAVKSETFQNKYSNRKIYVYKLENGAKILFDEFEKNKSKFTFCNDCIYREFCDEGPYSNGWEITPDLKLQICPMRHDLTVDLNQPENIDKLTFEKGEFHVYRKNI